MGRLNSLLKNVVRLVFAASLALTASAAFGNDRPQPPIDDVKTIADLAARDLTEIISGERHLDAVTQAEDTPFEDLAAVCRQPRNQFLEAMAMHMARYTAREPRGRRGEYGRELMVMNGRLRSDITSMGAALVPKGKGAFLEGDETLTARPETWSQALRQRAEWAYALKVVAVQLARRAKGGMEFSDHYAAGLWALTYCDYAADGARFLKAFSAHGGVAQTERDRTALAFVEAGAQH